MRHTEGEKTRNWLCDYITDNDHHATAKMAGEWTGLTPGAVASHLRCLVHQKRLVRYMSARCYWYCRPGSPRRDHAQPSRTGVASKRDAAIIAYIHRARSQPTAKTIAKRFGLSESGMRVRLARLAREGRIARYPTYINGSTSYRYMRLGAVAWEAQCAA